MKCIYYISCFISHFPCICSVQYFHYACYQEAARSRWILKLRYVDSFSIKTISSTHFSFHFHVLQISSHSLVWALLLKKKKKKGIKVILLTKFITGVSFPFPPPSKKSPLAHVESFCFWGWLQCHEVYVTSWIGMGQGTIIFTHFLSLELLQYIRGK